MIHQYSFRFTIRYTNNAPKRFFHVEIHQTIYDKNGLYVYSTIVKSLWSYELSIYFKDSLNIKINVPLDFAGIFIQPLYKNEKELDCYTNLLYYIFYDKLKENLCSQ